ncbi:MAG: alpha-hydroxy-acid oxidizing protein [Clostridium sp.]|nr:alpha-hydroxy-acid oxidizing protein [Clostridium sp.]
MEDAKRGNSDRITRDYFDSLFVEMRYIDGRRPDTSLTLYGETFATPIMAAALSYLEPACENGMVEIARGAKEAGAVNWVGMGEEEELAEVIDTGAKTIKMVKPHADNREVFSQIEQARKVGALAVGMDIDCAFDGRGEYSFTGGYDMAPKSMEEIRGFVEAAEIPFIVKGILSERDAYKCVMAGVQGIVISHSQGIMDYAVPPLMVLPDILRVVDSQIPVFVDCGIASGMDAFKVLALGATAVFAERRMLIEMFIDRGADGVSGKISSMNDELKSIMAQTGCYNLSHMDKTVLRQIRIV